MRPGPAPRLVVWLLEHYGSSSDNEALIGDLVERYHEGRSAFWCGKQAAVAVLVGAFENIRSHRLATLRAMAAGWLAYWTLGYVFFHFGFYQVMLDSLGLDNPDLLIGSWSPPVWWHNNSFGRIYTFGANAIATVAMGMIAVVSGWILATLFRPNQRSVVLVFSFTVLLSWICYSMTLGPNDIGSSLPWSAYFWLNSVLQTLGILMGAMMAERVRPSMA